MFRYWVLRYVTYNMILGVTEMPGGTEKVKSVAYSFFKYLIAGSLEAAYSLNWGAQEIWGKGGGETLALLW